ncbi:MAG: ABC transporter ATP-binding protein [Verrucomicrobiales bacterium]|nr:ABC transporter ATP-binding protein [Verrucomicrobiales bacterium]
MKPRPKLSETTRVLLAVGRRFAPEVRSQRAALLGATLAMVAEIVLRLVEPWGLKIVFDALLLPERGGAAWMTRWVNAMGRDGVLMSVCLLVVAVTGLRAAAAYAGTIGFAQAGSRVLSQVRGSLFRHLQCLSLAYHQRARGGDLVLRVINDVSQLQDVLVTAVVPLVTRMTMLAGMVALMLVMNLRLACLALVLLPLFWLRGVKLSRGIHEVARRQRRREGEMAATAAESLASMPVVQALSLEGKFAAAFGSRNASALREDVQGKRLSAKLERSVDVFIAAATALVLWQGTRMVWAGAMTPGDLLVFLAYLKTAFRPLQDSAKYSGRLAKAAAAGERVLAVLDERAGVADAPGAVAAPELRGQLRFEEVTFRHSAIEGGPGRGIEAVSFTVRPGQIAALVGASGSGKSTVLSLISRLHDPESGRVLVDGTDVRAWTVTSYRAQVGVVLQDTGLFAGSVADNIRAGREGSSDAEVQAAAVLAQADDFIRLLPEGYATRLGERGVTLSQGQRQRLAIARAALRQAPILLLDEPTAGLDEASARLVFDGLRHLAARGTVLVATHHPREAAMADVVLRLEHGRLVSSDPLAAPAEGGVHTHAAGDMVHAERR